MCGASYTTGRTSSAPLLSLGPAGGVAHHLATSAAAAYNRSSICRVARRHLICDSFDVVWARQCSCFDWQRQAAPGPPQRRAPCRHAVLPRRLLHGATRQQGARRAQQPVRRRRHRRRRRCALRRTPAPTPCTKQEAPLPSPDRLLTDRGSYIAYLESQLERVSAACLTVQSFDERLEQAVSAVRCLEEKTLNLARLVSVAQQYAEQQVGG